MDGQESLTGMLGGQHLSLASQSRLLYAALEEFPAAEEGKTVRQCTKCF